MQPASAGWQHQPKNKKKKEEKRKKERKEKGRKEKEKLIRSKEISRNGEIFKRNENLNSWANSSKSNQIESEELSI